MGKAARKRKEARAGATIAAKAKPQTKPKQPTGQPQRAVREEGLQKPDVLISVAIAAITFLIYWKTLSPSIYTSGAGENVTAVATLGIPHPPGFPLFCLLGKLFTLVVPVGTIAYRVNLFSAFAGAAANALLFLLIRSILGTRARAAAITAGLLFGVSRTFWSQAVIAEVYTLNAFLLLLIFFLLLRWDRGGSLLPAAFVAGLALTVHPLQALFFPGWLIFIFKSPRFKSIQTNEISQSFLLMILGAALHLYAPIRSAAHPVLNWGNPQTFLNFVAYISASQYRGRMFSMPLPEVAKNLGDAAKLLFHEFSPWLLILPLAGGWFCFRSNRRLFYTTAVPAAITMIYAINYDIPWEIDVYYIPAVLILAFWSAFALDWLASRLKSFAYALPLLAVLPLIHNFYVNDRSQQNIALALGEDILSTSPRGATLIVPNTDATFALLYLTTVEHRRPDLSIWVNDHGLRILSEALDPQVKPRPEVELLKMKKPVFQYGLVLPDTIPGFQQFPYGVLYEVTAKGSQIAKPQIDFASYRLEHFVKPPAAFYLDEDSRIILSQYYLSRGDTELAAQRQSEAKREYQLAEKMGGGISEVENQLASRSADLEDATTAIAHLRASLAQNDDALTQNRLGRLLIQTHQYSDAMTAFQQAIHLDSDLSIAHSNLGALLGMQGKFTEAFAELQLAVKLDPTSTFAHNNLARAYILTKNSSAAIAELQKSLSLDPNQPEVQQQLSKLQNP